MGPVTTASRTPLMQAQRNATASSVLRSLLRHGPQGRKRLAESSAASFTTITKIAADLLAVGALREVAPVRNGSAGGGRPETPLDLPGGERLVVGTHIHPDRNTTGVFDLRGNEVLRRSVPHGERSFDAVVRSALTLTQESLAAATGRVVGVGVATGGGWPDAPGLPRTGPNQWRMAELLDLFGDAVDVAVRVDTNVRALALEQHWWHGRGGEVLTIFVGRSVGIAQMSGDLLRGGRFGWGGSIAHLTVPGSQARCECGAVGCLDATCGDNALLAKAAEQGILPPDAPQSALSGDDPGLQLLRRQRAEALGRALPIVIRLVEPDVTILHGGADVARAVALAEQRYHLLAGADAAIEHHQGDRRGWCRTSAALALDSYLAAPWDVEESYSTGFSGVAGT